MPRYYADIKARIQPLPAPRCGECGHAMILRHTKAEGRPFFGCSKYPVCKGTMGTHPDGRPLGRPGDQETRTARKKAHEAFDSLWKTGRMKRSEAYALAAKLMSLPSQGMHIAMLDKECCEELGRRISEWAASHPES